MKLKKIEIAGFKSFKDKTTLDFPDNITAIVGPNGCGKSNIVDAIRWVTGEQRIKTLRGKMMDDVIFHGSDDAAPVGMAEVSIFLDSNGQAFPGAHESCTEVMITRRLFRGGESEYSINKVPCRLLDIRDFFMSAGIGTKTYSIVEQNSVSDLVEAKPEERRQFIEDAAGISKYKLRKEAASRKMEATKQNLLRLNDILKEVKSQLNAVSRQAKRAEQYKNLKKRIKEAEIIIALQTNVELSEKKDILREELRLLENQKLEISTQINKIEAAMEAEKAEIHENENIVSSLQRKLYDIKNDLNIKEQKIEFSKNAIKDITSRKQKSISDIDILKSRRSHCALEIEKANASAEELEMEIVNIRNAAVHRQTTVEELKSHVDLIFREIEEKKVEYINIVTEKAKAKNMLSVLEKAQEDIRRKAERDTREIAENNNRLEAARHQINTLRKELKSDIDRFEELKKRKNIVTEECETSKNILEEINEIYSLKKEELDVKSSRLASLKEFQESYAWCNEGTRHILTAGRAAKIDERFTTSFVGLVADHIEVPKEYETAVEAVLGEKLQYIVVRNQDDGIRAIDYLKSLSLGRSSFVPIEIRRSHVHNGSEDHLKEMTRLIDKVNVKDDFRLIAEYLLGDVVLIPNLRNGVSLWEMNGFCGTFVTLEGDIITPQGVLTGGSQTNGERSLLRNKREIAELEMEVADIAKQLTKGREERRKIAGRIAQWEEELSLIRSEAQRIELQINGKSKDIERFEDEATRIEQRIQVLSYNHETLKSEEKEALERIDSLRQVLASCEEREISINISTSISQEKWKAKRKEMEDQERALTEQKIRLTSHEEKRNSIAKSQLRLKEDMENIGRDIETKTTEIVGWERDLENLVKAISDDQKLLDNLYKDYQSTNEILLTKRSYLAEKESSLKALEIENREIRKALELLTKKINELDMEYRETAFQMESLTKSFEAKYYVDINTLMTEFKRLEDVEIEGISESLKSDRHAIDNFGEVNLLALNEHQQIKERHDFLTNQISDLNSSLDTLQKTIAKINQISKQYFSETFEAVNQCFKEVFSKIFPGGRGELKLTDENDLLETGVDINIIIPGKRAQSISLLSGGEKSLAAIALIFAILKYRPSPFLVLDEVDAALDDANISLFNQLVKDTAIHSQIIMVTHNKKTMEAADHLFGITMQRQGISSVVSVALN